MTDRTWFSCLLRHPARNRSRPLFLQPRSPHGELNWAGKLKNCKN